MRLTFLLITSSVPILLIAQTGPGGVGNSTSNVLWLDANYGVTAPTLAVTTWADRSGNSNTAVQSNTNVQPAIVANTANGYPVILFDNDPAAADHLRVADHATLEGMSGLTAFAVYQLAAGTAESVPRGFFTKRNAPDTQEAYAWFLHNGGGVGTNRNQYLDIDGTGNRMNSSPVNFATGTTYLNSFVYSGTTPSNTNDQVLYNGNTVVGNGIETSTSVPNFASDLYIGILKGHSGSGAGTTRFNGWMSEIIVYNYALGSAQRTIVNNYLAAKYGLAIASADLYVQDDGTNGNYDHDVAAIGRISSTDLQTDSRGSGMVGVSNATHLDDNEFLFWGHDNGAVSTWGPSTDVPAGVQARMTRQWRVSEVNTSGAAADVGGVNIEFDLTGFTPVFATHLRLLVDANNNGLFSDDAPIGGAVALGGNRYRFANVTALANTVRFTVGMADNTSLPIELVMFIARPSEGHVYLEWATASELDNDHFSIARSTDAHSWQVINELPGAGTSATIITYHDLDLSPLSGTSYYRLGQTDTDGTTVWSTAVVVNIDPTKKPFVFPNPNSGMFTIMLGTASPPVELFDAKGRSMPIRVLYLEDRAHVDATGLSDGIYTVLIGERGSGTFHRVVIKSGSLR